MHASSVHAFPHAISAVQSSLLTQALFSAQQLLSRHASHVGSPDERPQPPGGPPERRRAPEEPDGFLPRRAAMPETFVLAFGLETASFDFQPTVGSAPFGGVPFPLPGSLVHARVSVDVMA